MRDPLSSCYVTNHHTRSFLSPGPDLAAQQQKPVQGRGVRAAHCVRQRDRQRQRGVPGKYHQFRRSHRVLFRSGFG